MDGVEEEVEDFIFDIEMEKERNENKRRKNAQVWHQFLFDNISTLKVI